MIIQLEFSSLFISLSAAETIWTELLHALGKVIDNKDYTDEQFANMDWKTKTHQK